MCANLFCLLSCMAYVHFQAMHKYAQKRRHAEISPYFEVSNRVCKRNTALHTASKPCFARVPKRMQACSLVKVSFMLVLAHACMHTCNGPCHIMIMSICPHDCFESGRLQEWNMTGDQRVCLRQVAPPGSEKGSWVHSL